MRFLHTILLVAFVSVSLKAVQADELQMRRPGFKWAQKTDKVYITVEIEYAQNVHVHFEPTGKVKFTCSTGEGNTKVNYLLDLELLRSISPTESRYDVNNRRIEIVVRKSVSGAHWARLLKDPNLKYPDMKIDWSRWEEDD
mmetsp:Transcript_8501/g.14634  ORF Transcript_8501/g.14634 Transcript_8501/m.14634 type:complete len:141 (-) Transcript_8501:156-578(-)|eukprot:CAMPEP_0196656304 /NCGR_PEP_ID=MMETSP1086-20130531/15468_1 /TAXON_ID=77921 /ORGANISM="Cyanoptyche  gloeocystis , Strain SAG4.97" /LENGTH=140 /DNA_ID=CAMNT_0041989011 /DNA_START=45 /DNA_END=467 /DNA_ORIENTATION=-